MKLERAEWRDALAVLNETFKIWSPGLSKTDYYFYIASQLAHPWARKNYRYMVYRDRSAIAGSLKVYGIDLASRGYRYRAAGLGAVYTSEAYRGKGFGAKLMESVIRLARDEGFDAAYLFSDIDPTFYARFGFRQMGSGEFWIRLPDSTADPSVLESIGGKEGWEILAPDVMPVEFKHIPQLERHHRQWLRRQPYGVDRSPSYWNYKLSRELFLYEHSRWAWPRLELITHQIDSFAGGYAIVEHGQQVLRALEVVGSAEVRRQLWSKLIALAVFRGCTRIRGWEPLAPDSLGKIKLTPRSWGVPMLLPFRKQLEPLVEVEPCPLLELDHL
jgi:predicted acetyltransferase